MASMWLFTAAWYNLFPSPIFAVLLYKWMKRSKSFGRACRRLGLGQRSIPLPPFIWARLFTINMVSIRIIITLRMRYLFYCIRMTAIPYQFITGSQGRSIALIVVRRSHRFIFIHHSDLKNIFNKVHCSIDRNIQILYRNLIDDCSTVKRGTKDPDRKHSRIDSNTNRLNQ